MSASNALAWDRFPLLPLSVSAAPSTASGGLRVCPAPAKLPALRVVPLLRAPYPRRFVRVPTHAIGVHLEKREHPRASLKLPLKLRSIAGIEEKFPISLVTRDMSSSGVYFLCPKPLVLGAALELDVVLVSRPLGYGNVVVSSKARVCRVEPANMPGWYGVAASFDDFAFDRDDNLPYRFAAD